MTRKKLNRFKSMKTEFSIGQKTGEQPETDANTKANSLQENLRKYFQQLVADEQLGDGVQRLGDVKLAVERRLKRSLRDERRNRIASVEDISKLVNSKKPNVIVTKSEKQNQSLCLNTSIPMRILLKETQQERVLERHKLYENSWSSQAETRV